MVAQKVTIIYILKNTALLIDPHEKPYSTHEQVAKKLFFVMYLEIRKILHCVKMKKIRLGIRQNQRENSPGKREQIVCNIK